MGDIKKRRHHLVPRSYLQRFANEKGQVRVASRTDTTRRFTRSVYDVPLGNYFYSLPTDQGWDPLVEDLMGDNVEGPAKKDLDKLLARRSSTLPAFRSRLSYFLALQYIRGAATREARVDYFKSLFKMVALFATPEIIQAELLRQGEEVSLDDAEEILAVGQAPTTTVGLQPIGPQQLPADSLLHAPNLFKEAEQLKLYFYRRGWIVMQFANPCLLTSDEPVAIASADAPGQADGVGTAQTLVFPLDPRHALVMVHPEQQAEIHAWQLGTPEQARIINLHVAFKAHRHIIFHPDTDPLDGLVIPKKAPPTYRVGNYLMTSPHQSIETRRRMLEQIERSAR